MRKYITVKFNRREELEKFLEGLSKYIDLKGVVLDVRALKAVVGLEGDRADELKRRVLTLASLVKSEKGEKVRSIPLDLLMRELELPAPFPFDIAQYVLELLGYKAKVKGRSLLTNAELRLVTKVLEDLSRVYKEIEGSKLTASAKRLVATYSVVEGKGVSESVEELKRLKLLNEGNVISLAKDYHTAISSLEKILKSKARR